MATDHSIPERRKVWKKIEFAVCLMSGLHAAAVEKVGV